MKRNQQIFLLAIVVIVLLSIPFLFSNSINEKIVVGSRLLTVLTSLLTFIIAILLYNKFGIERSLIDKQSKEVFSLLENLNKSTIFLQSDKEFIRFNPANPYVDFYEEFYGRKILFSINYIEGLENVWKFSRSVFLPKEIAEHLKLNEVTFLIAKDKINDDDLKVFVPLKNNKDEKFGANGYDELTFLDFINKWNDLIEVIKSGFQKIVQ